MKLIYFTKTGNIERFIIKSNQKATQGSSSLIVDEDFVLITYTIGFGETPIEVSTFLEYKDNYKFLKGIIGSGNKNWGIKYCKAAFDIAEKYNVQVLQTFELAGNKHDMARFKTIIGGLNGK